MTEKEFRALVLEIVQEVLLDEIKALRQDMRELRKCSRESLEQVREMRMEFRNSMQQLHQQLERLMKMVEEKFSEDDSEKPFPDLGKASNWMSSTGTGAPSQFDRELSYSEMQTRLSQMEHRLGMLEKALQRN